MEYPLLILILGIVGGCAIAGYEILDAIERDEDQDSLGVAERARAVVLHAVPTVVPRASTPRASAQIWHVGPHGRGAGSGVPEADWLDCRIRGIEERLDRLEGVCLRLEAFRAGDSLRAGAAPKSRRRLV
jgi:hypothetical protein